MKHDELNQKRQKLHQDEQKLAYHVKLYKSGTFWIAAGITTVVLGITMLTGVSVASAADTDVTEAVKPAENSVSASSYRLKTSETAQTAASTESAGTVNNDSSISKETGDKSVDVAAKVTNLGDANRTQIDQAKEAASEQYAQTVQPQVVTAVSAPTPETAATGQVTIKYVDEDTQKEIADSYVATTTIKPDLVTEAKVKSDFAEPFISGYTFDKLGEGDTLNFAPVADGKAITAYYKNNSVTVPDTMEPTATQTEPTPEAATTGQITIKYVDEDTQAEIADSYVATTTIKPDLVTEAKVKSDFTKPTISGYTFDKLGEGDTLNFAPVADGKTITAYYKNNSVAVPDTTTEPETTPETTPETAVTGQITIKYVDEDTQAEIADSYVATTTIKSDLVTEAKVKSDFTEPSIPGYTFDKLGEGDTLNFAPVADGKTITAYYKNNSVAAPDTTTEPETTPETTPEATVTGQITIKYVDEDNPETVLSFNRDNAGFPSTAPATISGSYTATTTVDPDLVTKMKVKDAYVQPRILGYTFDKLGEGDTLNFAPVTDGKTITAYYKSDSPADTITEPTTTQTETTPETTVTGQVTIAYVDKDTQQLLGFNSGQSSIPGTPVQINGTYVAQTTVSTVDPGQLTVSGKVAQAEIAGYKFVGNDTTDLTFAPVDQQKMIKAYYEKLAPVVINYVNEAAPADVIFQIEYDAQDPANWISGSADFNFDYEPTFNGYTYDEQRTQADSVLIGNGFKSLDDTGGQPVTINIYYKKTTADPNPGAMYIGDTITKTSDITDTAVKKTNDLETPGAAFAHDKLPEVSAAKPITSAAVAINGHVVNQYPNYTLTGTIGTNNQDGNLAQGLMPLADYIPNQPVEVVFVDDSTGNILQQGLYGDFDLDKGVLPSGNYDTGVVNEAYQAKLADKGYELAKVYGEPTGTYDAMHRIVYYVYTPKLATNYVPVTRLINFTSSDGALNINPIVQTVWYKKVTNEVTNQSIYTPQSGFYQYEIPIVSGYSATLNDQPATVVAQEGLPATTGMPTNESVTVNYAKLQPVVVPATTGEDTPIAPTEDSGEVPMSPTNDGITNVTTDNQVPTTTENGGKTTIETDKDNGSVVANKGGSSAQTDVTAHAVSKQATNIVSTNASSTTHDQLPQTNEDNGGNFSLLGAVLVSMLGLFGIKKKRCD